MKYQIDVASLTIDGVNNAEFLVTRHEGTAIREFISDKLRSIPENECLFIDFKGVKFIDLSGSDEILAILATRIKSQEFGKRYISLINLSEQHLYNIDKALKDKGVSVVHVKDGTLTPIGSINSYLLDTFNFVAQKGGATARDLADDKSIPINTASTRLLNLYKEGLVKREEDSSLEGNKQFVYRTFSI